MSTPEELVKKEVEEDSSSAAINEESDEQESESERKQQITAEGEAEKEEVEEKSHEERSEEGVASSEESKAKGVEVVEITDVGRELASNMSKEEVLTTFPALDSHAIGGNPTDTDQKSDSHLKESSQSTGATTNVKSPMASTPKQSKRFWRTSSSVKKHRADVSIVTHDLDSQQGEDDVDSTVTTPEPLSRSRTSFGSEASAYSFDRSASSSIGKSFSSGRESGSSGGDSLLLRGEERDETIRLAESWVPAYENSALFVDRFSLVNRTYAGILKQDPNEPIPKLGTVDHFGDFELLKQGEQFEALGIELSPSGFFNKMKMESKLKNERQARENANSILNQIRADNFDAKSRQRDRMMHIISQEVTLNQERD